MDFIHILLYLAAALLVISEGAKKQVPRKPIRIADICFTMPMFMLPMMRKNPTLFGAFHKSIFQSRKGMCSSKSGCHMDIEPFEKFPMPYTHQQIDTQFRLYTMESRNDYHIVSAGEKGVYFDLNNPTFIYVHGADMSADFNHVKELKTTILDLQDANVLVVDWRKGAMVPQYSQAAANVRTVAAEIARFINGHMNNFGLDAKTIHCVGLGLGAQACALAAPKIQGLRRMGRITALDPDEPMYDTINKPKWRLSRHDAIFVDVIHTSGQSTWQSAHLGKPTGHADFFVNGFEWTGGQPGCEDFFMKISKSADNNTNELTVCSQYFALEYFLHSLIYRAADNMDFRAAPCNSIVDLKLGKCDKCDPETDCQFMGINAVKYPRRMGTFYVKTSSKAPYLKSYFTE